MLPNILDYARKVDNEQLQSSLFILTSMIQRYSIFEDIHVVTIYFSVIVSRYRSSLHCVNIIGGWEAGGLEI